MLVIPVWCIVLLFVTSKSNIIFDELFFDIENSFINIVDLSLALDDIVPSYEPTLEPIPVITLEPSHSPTALAPPTTFEPYSTFEPSTDFEQPTSFEPTSFEPPTQYPTTPKPTHAELPPSYNILHFYVTFIISNCTRNELNEYDKIVLLSSFAQVTELNIEYISLTGNYHILRKLLIGMYYTLEETIYISIPLIDEYETTPPDNLYDKIVQLVTESVQTGMLVDVIKSYNTTLFANIEIQSVVISEPVVQKVTSNNSSSSSSISHTNLAFIIVFAILGSLFVFLLFFWIHSNTKADETAHSIQNVNNVYETDVLEESRIVESPNNECSV